MWVAVHDQVLGVKSRKLASAIGCSQNEVIGILVRLWLWGLINADRDGKVLYVDEAEIAGALSLGHTPGIDPQKAVEQLVECGYLDRTEDGIYIHDWAEWQSYWYSRLDRRAKDSERKRRERDAKRGDAGPSEEPAPAKPKESVTSKAKQAEKYGEEFEKFWSVYPLKKGKVEAFKKYNARRKDGYTADDLLAAAAAYASECQRFNTEDRFKKHAKTFLGSGLPFLDYLPTAAGAREADDEENPYAEWGA